MSASSALKKVEGFIGKEVFLSDWTQITQDQINQFADSTMDHMWVHVDKEKAAQGPFGTTIAHGYLTLSLLPFFNYQVPTILEGMKFSINYGLDKVRFINPVVSGAKLRDRIVLAAIEEKPGNRLLIKQNHTLEIEGQEKPACTAEALTMLFF